MTPLAPTDAEEMRSHATDAAQLLKAMANEKRLMILCMLAGGEQAVSDINAGLDLSQSALSQHLALLREQGLVETRREAQTIFYALVDGPARAMLGTLHDLYCPPPAAKAASRRKAS